MPIIGRRDAIDRLQRLCDSPRTEFAVAYGRRRVGKTFLVREFFGGAFAFYASGVAGGKASVFIRRYRPFGRKKRGSLYTPYSLRRSGPSATPTSATFRAL